MYFYCVWNTKLTMIFPLSILKILFYCLFTSTVLTRNLLSSLSLFLCTYYAISLSTFKIVSLSLVLANLILMCLGVVSLMRLMVRGFSLPSLSILLGDSNYMYILQLEILLQLTESFSFFIPCRRVFFLSLFHF